MQVSIGNQLVLFGQKWGISFSPTILDRHTSIEKIRYIGDCSIIRSESAVQTTSMQKFYEVSSVDNCFLPNANLC